MMIWNRLVYITFYLSIPLDIFQPCDQKDVIKSADCALRYNIIVLHNE